MTSFCTLLVAAASLANVGEVVLFGDDGLVENRSAALAELVPWKSPDAALRLEDEKVEHLGGGAYAVTRTVKNVGATPVKFKDELRVRDCFAAEQQLFLVFVRAEPLMMGGGPMSKIPPQLGARAVALVWRDPTETSGSAMASGSNGYPHRTRILFYKTLE